MPEQRSNRSKRDNRGFKQRKILPKANDTQITMALATGGMCLSGGPQRSLFNLLANSNGDETITKYQRRLPKLGKYFMSSHHIVVYILHLIGLLKVLSLPCGVLLT